MKISDKDLEKCGFEVALEGSVNSLGDIVVDGWTNDSDKKKDIVYVMVRSDGECIKVGQSGRTFKGRMEETFATVNKKQHRNGSLGNSESNFQNTFLGCLGGQHFKIWLKSARREIVQYFPGKDIEVSLRHSEEEYFTKCFDPAIRGNLKGKK